MKNKLISSLKKNSELIQLLNIVGKLNLPNWYIGAGAIPQTYWNIIHGFKPNFGIKDYDVVYYDKSDLSKKSETALQKKLTTLTKHLKIKVDLKNEARVHLWYEKKFGIKIDQYKSTKDAINSWPTTASAIGIRLNRNNIFDIYSPFKLEDMFELKVRANKKLINQTIFEDKAKKWKLTWPKLEVISWDNA